jgi:hypothetical protein
MHKVDETLRQSSFDFRDDNEKERDVRRPPDALAVIQRLFTALSSSTVGGRRRLAHTRRRQAPTRRAKARASAARRRAHRARAIRC